MSLKDTLADEKRKAEHKATMRRLSKHFPMMAADYVIGWIQGDLASPFGNPTYKLHSIKLVVDAYDELQKEKA